MKKSVIMLFVFCVFMGNLFAQKPHADKIPTAAEMKAMMKEAQKHLDNLDPTEKKMIDSMEMKMPNLSNGNMKNLDKVTDK